MCKVTCIVPVYNVEKYIDKCLESLINQTLLDIEILVIDDGSTDGSFKKIENYTKKYPQKIKCITKENGGQGSARNLGLNIAKGEYIGFVDSDDWLELDAYEEMYNCAKQNNSDIVICNMVDNFEDGTSLIYDCVHYDEPALKTMSACNKLFKKDLIGKYKFPLKIWYEDFAFTTPLILKANIITPIDRNFYQCHVRNISTMNNDNSIKNLDIITAYEEVAKRVKNEGMYDRNKELLDYILAEHIVVTTVNRVATQNSKEKKEVIKKLIDYGRKNLDKDFNINKYFKCRDKNFKLIFSLNKNGFYWISKVLLKVSKKIRK